MGDENIIDTPRDESENESGETDDTWDPSDEQEEGDIKTTAYLWDSIDEEDRPDTMDILKQSDEWVIWKSTDGGKIELSTFCRKESGSKIFTFSYGLTTLVRVKFIGSCSLRSRQMAAKSYHSVVRNMDYKTIPSLLLSRPPNDKHTSLPPTLPRPSSVQKMIYAGLNFVLLARETENKN